MELLLSILTVLMWIVLPVLGLLLFLLNMPYLVAVSAAWDETHLDGRGWIGWPMRLLGIMVDASFDEQRMSFYLFGLRLKSWTFRDLKEKGAARQEKRKKKKDKKPKGNTRKKKRPSSPVETIYLARMPHKGHVLRQVARWFFLRGTLKGHFGFDDPCDTGELAMGLALLRVAFPDMARGVTLSYREPACVGRLRFSMGVWLPRLLVGGVALLVSRKGREMIRYYIARPKAAKQTT